MKMVNVKEDLFHEAILTYVPDQEGKDFPFYLESIDNMENAYVKKEHTKTGDAYTVVFYSGDDNFNCMMSINPDHLKEVSREYIKIATTTPFCNFLNSKSEEYLDDFLGHSCREQPTYGRVQFIQSQSIGVKNVITSVQKAI